MNIIIIDDNTTFREILARSLGRLDCEVVTFAHPLEALPTIEKLAEPIILLDLKLESDSGLKWIEQIRLSNEACRIILLTGYASISTAVEAIKLGADDYLMKPLAAREILRHINNESVDENIGINEKPMSIERLEWEHIQKILKDNNGNISATARAMGMHRRTLQRKLAKKPAKE